MKQKFNMQHIIVYVLVGVLLQWHNVEARPTTVEISFHINKFMFSSFISSVSEKEVFKTGWLIIKILICRRNYVGYGLMVRPDSEFTKPAGVSTKTTVLKLLKLTTGTKLRFQAKTKFNL